MKKKMYTFTSCTSSFLWHTYCPNIFLATKAPTDFVLVSTWDSPGKDERLLSFIAPGAFERAVFDNGTKVKSECNSE